MKYAKIILSLFMTCVLLLSYTQNTNAQDKIRAQKVLADINKVKNKEAAFKTLEKGFLPVIQSKLKDFKVSEVKVDRKTGMISVIGKNGKGQIETIDNIDESFYYDKNQNTSAASKGIFDWFWDWMMGTSAPEPADEHEGDPLPEWYGKQPPAGAWMDGSADN